MTTDQGQGKPAGAIAPAQTNRVTAMDAMLTRYQDEFIRALPKTIDPQRFMRIALTTWRNDHRLGECDPVSFAGAVLECAQLGLIPDMSLGQVYFLPWWNSKTECREVQLMIGYKGFVTLILRTGEITDVNAQVVYEKDRFDFEYGTKAFLAHSWDVRAEDRGLPMAVWFMADRAGKPHFQVLSAAYIAGVKRHVFEKNRWVAEERDGRTVAVATGRKGSYVVDTPWTSADEPEMWRKTAVRYGAKLLNLISDPLSSFQRAAALDERADIGEDQALRNNLPDGRTPAKLPPATTSAALPQGNPEAEMATRDRIERMKETAREQLAARSAGRPATEESRAVRPEGPEPPPDVLLPGDPGYEAQQERAALAREAGANAQQELSTAQSQKPARRR
jgi:phage RecT family recombinase